MRKRAGKQRLLYLQSQVSGMVSVQVTVNTETTTPIREGWVGRPQKNT